MTRLTYVLAAVATVAIVSPSLSQDKPASTAPSAPAATSTSSPGGDVKRESGKPDEGRREEGRRDGGREEGRRVGGEVRRGGDRDGMREMRRDGDRDGMRREGRGERREMRSGFRVEIGEERGVRRWHRRHQRIVVIHRHHRRHRHYH